MPNLTSVLKHLEQERNRLASQLNSLDHAISALNGKGSLKRGISAAGRARIATAQRARWAKAKGTNVVPISRKKRKLSASAIARIRTAQKARWAKWRKQKTA
jgi:hypothetical protein